MPLTKHMDAAEPNSKSDPHNVWIGVRRQESSSRASLPEVLTREIKYPPRKTSYTMNYHPLLDMLHGDVFDMHKRHGIEPNPLYKMGMGRVGCFPCIMARKSELKKLFAVSPEVVERLEEWERLVGERSPSGRASFISDSDVPDGVPMGIRSYAEYLRDGPELPGLEQDVGGCMSIYGLCE